MNHNAANAGIIAALINLCREGEVIRTPILARPKTVPTEFISIPVINAKCGGLNSPSTPKVSCQRKSDGPATKEIVDPIIRSFNEVATVLSLREVFLINKITLAPAATVNKPTPV